MVYPLCFVSVKWKGGKKFQDHISKLRCIKEVLISLPSKAALGDRVLYRRTEVANAIPNKKLSNTNFTLKNSILGKKINTNIDSLLWASLYSSRTRDLRVPTSHDCC